MTKVPAEMMREFVKSQKFTSTDEIMESMKDMFKNVLQQVLECELTDKLGYDKNESSTRFVSYKHIKSLMADLKKRLPCNQ